VLPPPVPPPPPREVIVPKTELVPFEPVLPSLLGAPPVALAVPPAPIVIV